MYVQMTFPAIFNIAREVFFLFFFCRQSSINQLPHKLKLQEKLDVQAEI
jgi:Na+/serine symporter